MSEDQRAGTDVSIQIITGKTKKIFFSFPGTRLFWLFAFGAGPLQDGAGVLMTRHAVQRPPSDQREPPAPLSAPNTCSSRLFFFLFLDVIKSLLFHLSSSQTGACNIGRTSIYQRHRRRHVAAVQMASIETSLQLGPGSTVERCPSAKLYGYFSYSDF